MRPSPQLAVDGIFGPITGESVIDYQRGVSLAPDGVVGGHTWLRLLRGDVAVSAPADPMIAIPARRSNGTAKAEPPGLWEWPLKDKFGAVLRRTLPLLPAGMRQEFQALLSPVNIGIMAAALVAWAASHLVGAGEAADLLLFAGGWLMMGMAVKDVAVDLGGFLLLTSSAADEKDLDDAATLLARAIAVMGVTAFTMLLIKVAKGKGKGSSGGGEKPPSPPKSEAPATREAPPPETQPEPPKAPARNPAKLAEGFAEHARPAEVRTAERLGQNPEFDGRTFEAPPPPDPGYDWVDEMGRTYDAMGDGTKSRYFKLREFTNSIDSHLLKGNDFTVIDMTGYTPEQIAAVTKYVDGLPAASQALIRRVGF
jgi:hypothetical protein